MNNPRLLPLLLLLGLCLWVLMIFGILYWLAGVIMLFILSAVACLIAWNHFLK